MKVLLVEGQVGESARAEEVLTQAGHEVRRCVEPNAASFPCAGLQTGSCPLEDEVIDAAVLVRSELADTRTPREDGARCALRRHVPLVLAGDVAHSPYAEWATAATDDVSSLPQALSAATAALLARHTKAATRSLQAVLVQHELDPSMGSAEVRRNGTELRVSLHVPSEVPEIVAEMAAVRAAGAIRDVDPYASRIDVTVAAAG